MAIYIDADAVVRWERGEFDLLQRLEERGTDEWAIPAPAWQQLQFGVYCWAPERALKRKRYLEKLSQLEIVPFTKDHAERAAQLAGALKAFQIGPGDLQIGATALADNAELLTFNLKHFQRIEGLKLVTLS